MKSDAHRTPTMVNVTVSIPEGINLKTRKAVEAGRYIGNVI